MTKASKLVAQLEEQASQMETRLRKKDERLKTLAGHIEELKAQLRKTEAASKILAQSCANACRIYGANDCAGCPFGTKRCHSISAKDWLEDAIREAGE